jgi:hypothetical protein
MRIPPNNDERESFYLDLMEKCMVSREERKADYGTLRSYYLFGAGPEEPPAYFNKIHPHLDQLTSFLYSAESTRFSINVGASVADFEHRKVPRLTMALNDEWLNSNADQVFSTALTWSLVYNTTFVKLVYNQGIHPYMIEPGAMGVLREDTPYVDRQEAICQRYYITRSELYARLYSHPKREQIVSRVTGNIKNTSNDGAEGGDGVARIVMSATNPTIYGQVNMDLYGMNKYRARLSEETIEMNELWVWNDEIEDYQCVTIASPDVIIYDRPGSSLFLKGEHPFVQICPNPQYDYFWGQSEAQKLMLLQALRNNRMTEILDLLSKQVSPPTSLTGFTGILDEKNFALNRAGGLLASDMPNAKAERMGPEMPSNLWEVTHEIDTMFSEVSGISNVLSGRGESGVRSQGHASQLARLGSSRAKKRALIVEDSLEKVATLYLKLMQVYDATHFKDTENVPFIAEQFTRDFVVKVDAHSNSPIFTEDTKELAFSLFKAQAIDKESLLDMLEPPMKQLLKDKLKRRMEKEASQPKPEPDAKKEK